MNRTLRHLRIPGRGVKDATLSSPAGVLALGILAMLRLSPPAFGVDYYPQIRVACSGRDTVLLNKGSRILGEYDDRYDNGWFSLHIWSGGREGFGDIDGDGRLDLVENEGVFLGHGDGNFGIRTVAFKHKYGAGFACGDLNHDGFCDVVVGALGVWAYLGRPDGTLAPAGSLNLAFLSGRVPARLKLVDLDADGDLDLIGGSSIGPLLAYNKGDGTFKRWDETPFRYPQRMVVCDLDRDGLKDLVTTGTAWDGETKLFKEFVYIYRGAGREKLADEVTMRIPGLEGRQVDWSWIGVTVGDVDRDGTEDILSGGPQGQLTLFRGKGDGTFRDPEPMALPVNWWAQALLLVDMDLDGHQDLLVGFTGAQLSYVYWGVEDGFVDFSNPTEFRAKSPWKFEVLWGIHRTFVRGDADDSGKVNLSDAVAILQGLFAGRAVLCGDASDVDDSGRVELTDAVYLLQHLFFGGPAPPYPYPEPGGDPTKDRSDQYPRYIAGDLGCSVETFRFDDYNPCSSDPSAQDHCKNPVRQFLDVGVPEDWNP